MKLGDWMERNRVSATALAAHIGTNSWTVGRYANGQRMPSREAAVAIYLATGGAVDPNSFYDLPPLDDGQRLLPVAA